jgi:hypothetical protein
LQTVNINNDQQLYAYRHQSIYDMDYCKNGNDGDAYVTTTRIPDGGTTTTTRMMPSPQEYHHHNHPHQQQERHFQIHHHHHQMIHHHYHYRAPPPPTSSLQSSSIPPTKNSIPSMLAATTTTAPPPHTIAVVNIGTSHDTSITSSIMKNKLTIPVVDDMIVERINEEQAAGRNDDGRNGWYIALLCTL